MVNDKVPGHSVIKRNRTVYESDIDPNILSAVFPMTSMCKRMRVQDDRKLAALFDDHDHDHDDGDFDAVCAGIHAAGLSLRVDPEIASLLSQSQVVVENDAIVPVYWSADIDKWLKHHVSDAIRQLSFVDKVSSYDEVVLLLRALFQWFSIDQSAREGVDSYPVYQHLNQLVGSIISYQEEISSHSMLWDFWCSHLLSSVLSLREKVYLSKRHPHVSSDALHKSFQEYLIRILIELKDHCDKHDLSKNTLHHQLVSVAIKGLIDLFYSLSSSHFSQANTWLSLAVQCEKLKRLQNNHLIKPTVDNSFINQIINTCGVQAFKCFMGDATRDYEINFSWIGVLGRFLCMKNSANTRDTHRSAIKLLYHYFVVSVKSQQESSSLELGNGIDFGYLRVSSTFLSHWLGRTAG